MLKNEELIVHAQKILTELETIISPYFCYFESIQVQLAECKSLQNQQVDVSISSSNQVIELLRLEKHEHQLNFENWMKLLKDEIQFTSREELTIYSRLVLLQRKFLPKLFDNLTKNLIKNPFNRLQYLKEFKGAIDPIIFMSICSKEFLEKGVLILERYKNYLYPLLEHYYRPPETQDIFIYYYKIESELFIICCMDDQYIIVKTKPPTCDPWPYNRHNYKLASEILIPKYLGQHFVNKTRLIISAGELEAWSFSALLWEDGIYLIDRFEIIFTDTRQTYAESFCKDDTRKNDNFKVSVIQRDIGEEEVKYLQSKFRDTEIGHTFEDLSKTGDSTIIHIIAHSSDSESRNPLNMRPKGYIQLDKRVYEDEISNLKLPKVRFVFLSSCSLANGENHVLGTLGLLFVFGQLVPSVLGSLRNVKNNVAQYFAEQFYAQLKPGVKKSTAFKNAVTLLKQEFQDPNDWCAWVLHGCNSPLIDDEESTNSEPLSAIIPPDIGFIAQSDPMLAQSLCEFGHFWL